MVQGSNRFLRVVGVLYLVCLHVLLGYLVYQVYLKNKLFAASPEVSVSVPVTDSPVPTPIAAPSELSDMSTPLPSPAVPEPSQTVQAVPDNPPQEGDLDLVLPVKGIKRSQLTDTFTQARSQGRVHNAIDIMAPGGTPVLAAGDGEIVKFFDSKLGGTTIYQISKDGKYFYYYAHLRSRAENLREHDPVTRGTVIGYVGDTGDAGPGNFHLHFAIYNVVDPKRWWDGVAINPFPIMQHAREVQ